MTALRQALLTLLLGVAYWSIINRIGGTREPWDGAQYWMLAYPLAIAIAGVLGAVFRKRGWLTGALFILAQLPVMLVQSNAGPLLPAGLAMLAVLSLPPVVVASLAAWLRNRFDRG